MVTIKRWRFVFILAVFTVRAAFADQLPHFSDDLSPKILAEQLVSSMNDREVLGQVLMFGYQDEEPSENILNWISQEGLGAVKVFGWNANTLSVLANTVGVYQRTAVSSRFGIPLLIATDQEGGWVRHIKGSSSITPGNMALGADPVPADALETGRIIGRELAAVGVNMNFAPTIDVFVDPKADVIGPRAFMKNPYWAGLLGMSFAKGQEEAGVISTAKHFPGHGDTSDDSHGTLPVVLADLETLRKRDLVPYRTMIGAGLPAIMVGHLAFPAITPNPVPATLSPKLLQNLLRNELNFDGVVITDDLFMQGARSDGAPLYEVCYRAMLAGADILLVSQGPQDHREIYQHLLNEMQNADFNQRVRNAAERVIAMKAQWLKAPNAVPLFPDPLNISVPAAGSKDFFLAQAARSITLVRGKRFPIPKDKTGRVLLAGSYTNFFNEGLRRYPDARSWNLNYDDSPSELIRQGQELARAAVNYDTVIVLLPDKEMAILLDELEPLADRIIVISVLSPAHLDRLSWVQTSLAAYGTGRESFRAAFAALSGDFVPEGRLPIPLETAP